MEKRGDSGEIRSRRKETGGSGEKELSEVSWQVSWQVS